MADETTQTEEETSWWAFDAFADSELPPTAFDEPLEWPETLDWGDFARGGGDLEFPSIDELASDPIFPEASPEPPAPAPAPPAAPQAADAGGEPTMPHVTVLSGLGGSAAPPAPAGVGGPPASERLPDSLWAPAPIVGPNGNGKANGAAAPVVTTTMPAPAFYAEPDAGGGGWRRRFDLRHGNAAVIALISFVSLVLLGMFMSVRARNDVPDTSQTKTTSNQIAVQAPLNTIPLTTTVTTAAPAPINIAELVPPTEDATTPTAGSGSGGSTATTAAPARSTPAASTATTQPAAAEPTATTVAAPQSTTQPQSTTTPTSAPVDQTTQTTLRRPTFPTVATTTPDSGPSYSIPSIPGFPSFPNF